MKSVEEVTAMLELCQQRRANYLLNVGPDDTGRRTTSPRRTRTWSGSFVPSWNCKRPKITTTRQTDSLRLETNHTLALQP